MAKTAPVGTRLYLQHHGNMHMDARRMAGVSSYFQRVSDLVPRDMWRPCPCLTCMIRHPAGVILFDLGCPTDWKDRWQATGISDMVPYDEWTEEQQLESMLAKQGLRVSDVILVVASHLHMDHCGKLNLFERTGIEVILQRAEYEGAMALPEPGVAAYVTSQYKNLDIKWKLIDGDVDLMEGIQVLSLPGHSFGTQGMAVHLKESGTIVLASDAAQVLANLQNPPVGSPNIYDSLSWRKSIARLRRMRDEEHAIIVCGHEPTQLSELKLSPRYYT